jgi:hypothetical protein
MGGLGSGIYARIRAGKRIVESTLSLNILWLKRKGLLIPGLNITLSWSRGDIIITNIETTVYENYLLLIYTFKKTKDVKQKIYFDWTPCYYGSERVWFRCPFCDRRCAIIYFHEKYFACRICCNLTYKTSNETYSDRKASKSDKLRKRIGAKPGVLNFLPLLKPKGMHLETWARIRKEIQALRIMVFMDMNRKLDTLHGKLHKNKKSFL